MKSWNIKEIYFKDPALQPKIWDLQNTHLVNEHFLKTYHLQWNLQFQNTRKVINFHTGNTIH